MGRPMQSNLRDLQAPDLLRDLPGWLVWRFKPNGDKKPRKVPFYVSGAARWGAQGTAADRKRLTTFDHAKRVALENGYEGVGFAPMPEFGISALDFDDCVTDGVINPVVESLTAGTYTEFSPSGNGIRAFVVGSLGTGKSNPKDKSTFGFEVFDCNGFVTFTGNVTPTTELVGAENYFAPISPELKAFRDSRLNRARETFEYEGTGETTLGLSDLELHQILNALPSDLSYDEWVNTGMAIHHETQGEGFALWDEWSLSNPKGTTTGYNLERWVSFGRNGGAPYTARSLLRYARDELHVETGIDMDTAHPDEFPTYDVAPGGKYKIRSWEEVRALPRSTSWLIKGFLPKAVLGVLFGASTAGKSFVALDMACAISRGVDWNGHRVNGGRVLYVVAEGQNGFLSRMDAYDHVYGIEKRNVDLITEIAPNLTDRAQVTDLIKDIRAREPYSIIIMDTFAQMTAGINENSGEDMGNALEQCKRIGHHTGAMVLLVHHSGKDAAKGARGWSGLRAAADVELEVTRNDEVRSIKVTKLKDGRDGAEHSFKLVDVVLGLDDDDDPITSCVVEYGAPVGNMPTGKNEILVLTTLHEMMGLDRSSRINEDELLKEAKDKVPNAGRDTKSNLKKALSALAAKNFVVRHENWVSPVESAKNAGL